MHDSNTMTNAILNKLYRLFSANNWNTVEITMKSTGLKIALTPYFDDYGEEPDPRDMEHCAFITGCGQQDAIWYTGKPRSVARDLANHDEIHARWMKQAVELTRMSDEVRGNWSDDAWSYYSDMYKDVYGHRPTRYPDGQ